MKRLLLRLTLAGFALTGAAQETLVPGLRFLPGPANGALLERNGKRLVVYGDPSRSIPSADFVLLTHARRDVTWSARELVRTGTPAVVPEKEADLLAQPERFWAGFREKRFHDYAQQSTKLPVEPMPVPRRVKGGDRLEWEGLTLRVLETPGYTRGAVSYLVDLDGKRVGFTGDLVRDDGRLQDLFSLQDAIPAARIGGYHGWAGRLGDVVASLSAVAAEKPDLLIPSRGAPIRDPAAAIDRALVRIRRVYTNYLSVDALRYYFKDEHILAKARRVLGPDARVDWMPMAAMSPLPPWIRAISNSRLVLAADRSGLLVDCGGTGIVDELRKLRAAGQLTSLTDVFVTHYHDDHTDALPVLVAEFGARVHACASLIGVLERPADYRLPCLTKNPIAVTARHADRDTWRWKEFALTIFDFPGQTLHHNGLLMERDGGGAAFFAGDSFTPSGIDDYCLQNRNFLRDGAGYFRCLDLVERLPQGCLILNQHVDPAFQFGSDQVSRMRDTLRQRLPLLAELLPFDDPNYGLDEGWAVIHPYAVHARPGDTVPLEFRVTNHSPQARRLRASVRAPAGWAAATAEPVSVPPHADGALAIQLQVPAGVAPGLRVIVADLMWGESEFREWVEALVEVGS